MLFFKRFFLFNFAFVPLFSFETYRNEKKMKINEKKKRLKNRRRIFYRLKTSTDAKRHEKTPKGVS
jgi:hypothetical protein